ncbi:MAG: hypothetical protein WBA98_13630 [Gordonia sp. (in: high G+C Gram-positive bacteria)]|uniref:hypothetical protein n=1 Tax=Gordonia sp. (in: high G+C Gram-positive bacteria) TaxID=84139 RepID=UPI003C75BB73
MIYRTSVRLQWSVDTGEEDAHGNPITSTVDQTVLANVWALGTDQKLDAGRAYVRTRYQMILAPTVDIPPGVAPSIRVTWKMYTMFIDGGVERHYVGSKLHHYELITKEIVG